MHLSLCCSTFDVSDNYEKTEQIPNSLNSWDYSFGKPEAHPTLSSTLEIYLRFRVWQWQVTSTLGWFRHPTAMPAGCLLGEELQVCPISRRRPRGRRTGEIISRVAWEHLSRERKIWASLQRLLSLRPGPRHAALNGWMHVFTVCSDLDDNKTADAENLQMHYLLIFRG